ncbi:MAG: S-layer homology domain-containing protein [Filifactoraceae bacterium]
MFIKKRILPLLLTLSIIFSMLPMQTLANDQGFVKDNEVVSSILSGGESSDNKEIDTKESSNNIGSLVDENNVPKVNEGAENSNKETNIGTNESDLNVKTLDIVSDGYHNILEQNGNRGMVTVRIEGNTETFVTPTSVLINEFDLSSYGVTEEYSGFTALHAIIKALEKQGIDCKEPRNLELTYNGGFIAGVKELSTSTFPLTHTQFPYAGWMYTVNGVLPNLGVLEQNVNDGDDIVLFFATDMMQYYFKNIKGIEPLEVKTNESFTINFEKNGWDEELGDSEARVPVSGATILIDNVKTDYVTDDNGNVTLSFDKEGTYELSAIKEAGEGLSGIARPYCKVIVTSAKVDKKVLSEEISGGASLSSSGYTPLSWSVFQKALEIAKMVGNDGNATQVKVDEALTNLKDAKANLYPIIIPFDGVPDDWQNDLWLQYDYKELSVGGKSTIYPRQVPEAITDPLKNDVERPNFNFEVISGNSIKLEPITIGGKNDKATVTAVKEGISIIKVTYDEFTHSRGTYFGAVSPVNYGYAVINVVSPGKDGGITIKSGIDLNAYETIYFKDGNSTDYEFTPTITNATSIEVTCNGIELSRASNGAYNAALQNRSNIIGITAKNDTGSKSFYQVIDARKIDVNIENVTHPGKPIAQGDTGKIDFKGITMPVYKLATIYNPILKSSSYVQYKNATLGNFQGKSGQYDLATKNSFQVKFDKPGNYSFESGEIYEEWYGSPLGTDKGMEGQGAPNLNAPKNNGFFGSMPNFTITVEKTLTVDKSLLVAKIESCNSLVKTDYSEQSWSIFTSALSNAKKVKDNVAATQVQVDEATLVLTNAIKGLQSPIKGRISSTLETISSLPIFTGATDDWSVMDMVAYGKKEGLTNKASFVSKAITTAKGMNNPVTDYERVAISLTSMGYDVSNLDIGDGQSLNLIGKIAGYKAINPTPSMGTLNSYIFGLIAYDSGKYILPADAYWTREKIVDYILEKQSTIDGGWNLNASTTAIGDVDITAMAISALVPYKDQDNVKQAIDKAVEGLSVKYNRDNGFKCYGSRNSNSASMVVIALSALNIDGDTDTRFITKDGVSLLQHLFTWQLTDKRFGYTNNTTYNGMATEQAFRALISYDKMQQKGGAYNVYNFERIENPKPSMVLEETIITDVNKEVKGTIPDVGTTLLTGAIDTGTNKNANLPHVEATKSLSGSGSAVSLNIPQNTVVTAPKSWDGKLELQKVVTNSMNIPNKTIILAVKIGSDSVDLSLSNAARIVLPETASYKVAYIGSDGEFKEITNELTSDDANGLGDKSEGKIKSGNDWIIWTKHFTKFVAYSDNPQGGGETNGGNNGGGTNNGDENKVTDSKEITVRVSVTGDSSMGDLIDNYSVTVPNDSVAWVAIKKAFDAKGISYVIGFNDNYIRSIGGLGEFDRGPNSGWLYYVNGTKPNIGVGEFTLSDNSNIHLKYTLDWMLDEPWLAGTINNLQVDETVMEVNLTKGLDNLSKKGVYGDWEAFVLALNGYKIKSSYTDKLLTDFKNNKGELRLATDYARLSLVLKAMGQSITSYGGYNILDKIVNNKEMGKQGVNGYIFSLVVMSSENVPSNSLWNSDKIIDKILAYQNEDGGFSLQLKGKSDVDITAMALTSFAPYKDQLKVKAAIDKGISFIKAKQAADGHFESYGDKNVESTAQVVIALCALGIDPTSSEFTKDGKTLLDVISLFKLPDETFCHVLGGSSNGMATEQAYMALTAFSRYKLNLGSIYNFKPSNNTKNSFKDVKDGDWYFSAVSTVSERGLFSGTSSDQFSPNQPITRAMFATVLAKLDATDLKSYNTSAFRDVDINSWYGKSVAWAADNGILSGYSKDIFGAEDAITREQMAVMLDNYISFKGIKLKKSDNIIEFTDVQTINSWARTGVRNIHSYGLINGKENNVFMPQDTATRAEVAQLFSGLLNSLTVG